MRGHQGNDTVLYFQLEGTFESKQYLHLPAASETITFRLTTVNTSKNQHKDALVKTALPDLLEM